MATLSHALIDPATDDIRPVAQVARERTGKRPSPATVWCRTRRGVRGVRLEAVLVSGVWHTTPAAWGAFVTGQTAAALADDPADDPPAGRPDATRHRLAAAGLLAEGDT